MTEKSDEAPNRRDFLKFAGIAGPGAIAVVTGGEAKAAEPDLSSNRMQDTAHTRAYFETARF